MTASPSSKTWRVSSGVRSVGGQRADRCVDVRHGARSEYLFSLVNNIIFVQWGSTLRLHPGRTMRYNIPLPRSPHSVPRRCFGIRSRSSQTVSALAQARHAGTDVCCGPSLPRHCLQPRRGMDGSGVVDGDLSRLRDARLAASLSRPRVSVPLYDPSRLCRDGLWTIPSHRLGALSVAAPRSPRQRR